MQSQPAGDDVVFQFEVVGVVGGDLLLLQFFSMIKYCFDWGYFSLCLCVGLCVCVFLCVYVCVCMLICVFAQPQGGDGYQHYKVRARLAVFNKHFKEAESIYLEGVSEKLHVCTSVIMLVLSCAVLCILCSRVGNASPDVSPSLKSGWWRPVFGLDVGNLEMCAFHFKRYCWTLFLLLT